MKRHVVILVLVAIGMMLFPCVIGGVVPLLWPEDKSRVNMYTLDISGIDDISAVWDFSGLTPYKDISVRFRNFGDSLIAVSLPGVKHDFRVNNDTVYLASSESHFSRIDYDFALERLLSGVSTTRRFDVTGRRFSSQKIYGQGVSVTSIVGRGTLVLSMGDTVTDVVLNRTLLQYSISDSVDAVSDSLAVRRMVERYSWIAPGYTIPLVTASVTRDTVSRQPLAPVKRCFICPPASQTVTGRQSSRYTDKPSAYRENPVTAGMFNSISVLSRDGNVSVRISLSQTSCVSILLCDVYGRVFASRDGLSVQAGNELDYEFDCSGLTRGEYIIKVTAGSLSETKKFILR